MGAALCLSVVNDNCTHDALRCRGTSQHRVVQPVRRKHAL